MATFRLSINGQERQFDVSRQGGRLHISAEGLSAGVRILQHDSGRLLLELERPDSAPTRLTVYGLRRGDQRQLWVNGHYLKAECRRMDRADAGDAVAAGALSSSIPAVVAEVLVGVGDLVDAGDRLILLESMKMVIPIQAPHRGRVARILCDVGESVKAGALLVELETT